MKLPKHKAELSLTHNEHKSYYETVIDCLGSTYHEEDWISIEQFEKSLETDNVWTLVWYPDTPIGFIRICACDLSALIEYIEARPELIEDYT